MPAQVWIFFILLVGGCCWPLLTYLADRCGRGADRVPEKHLGKHSRLSAVADEDDEDEGEEIGGDEGPPPPAPPHRAPNGRAAARPAAASMYALDL